MGSTQTNWVKGTKVKDWFAEQYNNENDKVKQTVLDTALVARTEAFAAIEQVNKETGERKVFMAVVIMKFNNSEYYNFMYKTMDETCGPHIHRCPKRLMKLLTPTDHEYALKWRARVNEYWTIKDEANAEMKKLNAGDTVVFKNTISFNNGTKFKSLQVLSLRPLRFSDGTTNLLGGRTSFKISRRTLDSIIDHVVQADKNGQVERVIPDIKDLSKYPKYHCGQTNKDYTCILWAQGKNRWEWFGFELDDKERKIYYGYVMGAENEWGYFSLQELLDAGVDVITDPKKLCDLAPPLGGDWTRKPA